MQQEPFTLPDEVTVISIIDDHGDETATIAVPRTPIDRIYDHDGNAWATDARTTDPDWLGVASAENRAKRRRAAAAASVANVPGWASTAAFVAKVAGWATTDELDAEAEGAAADLDTLITEARTILGGSR